MPAGACALLIGAFATLPDIGRAAEPARLAARPALTVTTTRAQRLDVPLRLAANGNIVAWQEAIIGSEANGLRLNRVNVNVGDKVRAGHVLATYAADSIEADVALARAHVEEARAMSADAEATIERARGLEETGAMSQQQINTYATSAATAEARVQAAAASLRVQQLRLRYTQVRAPDDGIISSRSATVGAVVPAGTELFRLIRKNRLEWRAEVTSAELERIERNAPVLVTAASGAQIKGKVRIIAPTVDAKTRTALVYVDLDAKAAASGAARAGMFARGEFDLGQSQALTVPQQAVVLRDGFNYVFKVDDQQHVRQLKVDVGRRFGERVEIKDGLMPEESIVATGAGFLNDGDLVRVVPPSQAPGTAPLAAAAPASAAAPK